MISKCPDLKQFWRTEPWQWQTHEKSNCPIWPLPGELIESYQQDHIFHLRALNGSKLTTSLMYSRLLSKLQPVTWITEESKCEKQCCLMLNGVSEILEGCRLFLDINKSRITGYIGQICYIQNNSLWFCKGNEFLINLSEFSEEVNSHTDMGDTADTFSSDSWKSLDKIIHQRVLKKLRLR